MKSQNEINPNGGVYDEPISMNWADMTEDTVCVMELKGKLHVYATVSGMELLISIKNLDEAPKYVEGFTALANYWLELKSTPNMFIYYGADNSLLDVLISKYRHHNKGKFFTTRKITSAFLEV